MNYASESGGYLSAVARVLGRFSARYQQSPSQLLRNWQQFVDTALDGYPASWYDFDNERGIRDVIQAVLDDREVRTHPEAQEWQRLLADVDERYRALLVPLRGRAANAPWWKAGVPRYAGHELAQDIGRMYGTEVAVRQ